MEPATAKSSAPPSAFPIEKVRAAFPALEREVNGKPVAYLDSGASSQRVLASIQAVDRYERAPPLQRPPRLPHALGRGDRSLRGGAGDGRRPHRRRRPPRGPLRPQRDRGDQPRRPGLGRRQRRRRRPHPPHRDGAPLQHRPLAAAGRAGRGGDRLGADRRRGAARHGRPSRRCSSAGRSWSPSPTSPTCSGPRTRWPRSPAWPTTPGALVLADGAQAAPKLPLDVAELGVDFYAITGHKLYGPTGIGALWGRLDLLREMPPFLGGGSMIRKVTQEGTTYADVPARFEAGTPAIAQAIGMASALRWLDGARDGGGARARARDRRLRAGAARRGARPAGLRPAARPRAARPGLLRARGHPRPRRLRDPRPPRRRRPRRPPLRPDPHGPPRRRRHGPRQLRRLHDARGDRPPGRRPRRRAQGLRPG